MNTVAEGQHDNFFDEKISYEAKVQSNKPSSKQKSGLMSPTRASSTKQQLMRRATHVGQNIISFHDSTRKQNTSFTHAVAGAIAKRSTPNTGVRVQSPKSKELYVVDANNWPAQIVNR